MAKATRFGEAEYQEMFGPGGAGYAPDAVEFSNAAYDRMFSEEAGYPQRDPNAEPYRPPPPDPRAFLNDQFEQFKGQYKATYKRLKRLHGNDVESFNRDIAELDVDAEQFEARHASTMGQIDYIQKLIDSGYNPEAGLRAQREAVGIRLPAPVKPEQEPRGRFSPTQMGYSGYPEMIEDMQIEGLNIDGSYNSAAMKQQYFRARDASFYNQFNTAQKREWDTMWANGFYDPDMRRQWETQKQNDPDLFTSTADNSSVMRAVAKKASPLARSMAKGLFKPSAESKTVRMRGPTGQEFDVPIGKVQAAIQEGGTMVVSEEAPAIKPRRRIPPANFGWASRSPSQIIRGR